VIGHIGRRICCAAVLVVAVLQGSGCRGTSERAASERAESAPLVVMEAASLNRSMPALLQAFEEREGVRGTLVLGATGSLAAQLANGAPADLFFSADESTVDRLVAEGILDPITQTHYANGVLVLVTRRGVQVPRAVAELVDARFTVVALANPDLAPYGAAARQAMQAAGVWEVLAGRLVYGENVAGTWQLVQSGNADAAFVAQSVVPDSADVGRLMLDPSQHLALRQAAAVVVASRHPAARDFLHFVHGADGQAILRQHGFAPPQ
jgi:molybdate transport system substrate-binding protein